MSTESKAMDTEDLVAEAVVVDEQPMKKKAVARKRRKAESSDEAPAKKKKKGEKKTAKKAGTKKKRSGILDDLTPQRKREINHIIRRAKKHSIITPSFITSALRSAKLAGDKITRIGDYNITLEKQLEHALDKAKDDEKKERVKAQFARKLARLGRIKDSFSKGNRVCLKAQDEVFLSKIKLPKPLSGYMLFAKESREEIQKNNPEAGFGEIGRLIGGAWKSLLDDARTEWKTKASSS
jgi:hypothetical protein